MRSFGDGSCAERVGEFKPTLKRAAALAAPIPASQRGTELDERFRVLEPVGRAFEDADRLVEACRPLGPALGHGENPQGASQSGGRPPGAGEVEVLAGEALCLLPLSERKEALRTPIASLPSPDSGFRGIPRGGRPQAGRRLRRARRLERDG